MAADSPSYQTTMPAYPDVSYDTYMNQAPMQTKFGRTLFNFFTGSPSYDVWRQNLLDEYNAQVQHYNAYASSPQGNRAQLEAAGYNANYSPNSVSQASPLSFQDVRPDDGLQEVSQGIGGLLQLVNAVQGFKSMAAGIVGKQLDNQVKQQQIEGLKIDNLWKDRLYQLRSVGLGIENMYRPGIYQKKTLGLGYQADAVKLRNETELSSRFGSFAPDSLFVGDHGDQYNLFGANKGLMYQKAVQDISSAKAAVRLRDAQTAFAKMNTREKEFVIEQIKPVYLNLLKEQLGILKQKNAFIPTEQDIYRKAFKWKVGLGTANTAISLVKTGVGLFNPVVGAVNAASPVQGYAEGFGDQFL